MNVPNKPCILYPNGQGGHWLSNLLYGLETGKFDIITPAHKEFNRHPLSQTFIVEHEEFAAEPIVGAFSGPKSRIIWYSPASRRTRNRYQMLLVAPSVIALKVTCFPTRAGDGTEVAMVTVIEKAAGAANKPAVASRKNTFIRVRTASPP